MITQAQATALGCIAIILWSVDTIINIYLARLPIFQILGMAWLLSFLIYALVLSMRQEWHKVLNSPWVWIIGSVGICGAHFCLVWSLRIAPASQITVISAIWPIIVIAMGGWMLHQQRKWISLSGAGLGFVGVWLVLTEGKGLDGYHWNYSYGYLLAVLSCLLWSSYVIMTRKKANITSEMMGMYLGVGGVFALIYHLSFENFVMPYPLEWILLVIKGCITLSVSYFCWDFAIKRGKFALLNVLAYFNPVLTLLLLSMVGLAVPKMSLWFGGLLVTLAAILCSGVLTTRVKN
jgi:drug/metabolite transporter (DMT)-like permease